MKILFVNHTSGWSGPSKSLLLLIDHMSSHVECTVVSTGNGPLADALSTRGIEYIGFDSLGKQSIPKFYSLLRSKKYDLVYSNTSMGEARSSSVAALLARIPFYCHVREMGWDRTWWDLGYMRFAKGVIAVSDSCGQSVKRFSSSHRLHVVHNGVPAKSSDGSRDKHREELVDLLGITDPTLIVVCCGHLMKRKNQLDALSAFREMAGSDDRTHLIFAGATDREPDYVEDLKERISVYGLEQQVTILGFRDDVLDIMDGSDLFLLPTLADPHPRVVLEAMQMGLPVISYSTDGVAETVVHGETGMLVPKGDVKGLSRALTELGANIDLRNKMAMKSVTRVGEQFSAARTSHLVEGILRESVPN
jgi:glycosyltransferase involved in cell wall biosynthesis